MSAVHTYSGLLFNLENPSTMQVSVFDIARSLARIPRWNGNTTRPWSVADHSVWVAQHLRETGASMEVQLAGLLHDAHEAYVGNIPSPVIRAYLAESLLPVTARIDRAIEAAFHLPMDATCRPEVVAADALAAQVERRDLLHLNPSWPVTFWDSWQHRAIRTFHETPEKSQEAFLKTLDTLLTEYQIVRDSENSDPAGREKVGEVPVLNYTP